MDPIAFYLALHFSKFEEIKEKLTKYIEPTAQYLVVGEKAMETHQATNGEHFHFLVQMSQKAYTNFTKHFIMKYKLRGNAKNGIGRQYGKIKNIKDLERLHSYMLKDQDLGNPIYTNYENDEIDKWAEKSFKKKNKKTYLEEFSEKITDRIHSSQRLTSDNLLGIKRSLLRPIVFDIHISTPGTTKAITISQINSIINYWIQFHGLMWNYTLNKYIKADAQNKYLLCFDYNFD